jgi:hypothetical protein
MTTEIFILQKQKEALLYYRPVAILELDSYSSFSSTLDIRIAIIIAKKSGSRIWRVLTTYY